MACSATFQYGKSVRCLFIEMVDFAIFLYIEALYGWQEILCWLGENKEEKAK